MKKLRRLILIYISLLLTGTFIFQEYGIAQAEVQEQNEPVVIPDDAIRLRILANSDNKEDQEVKRYIRDQVNEEITTWVKDIRSLEEARSLIEERIPEIEEIVKASLKEKGLSTSSTVEYGSSVNFPTKIYGNYIYPAGQYEAILITLGDGLGSNWWCVLFPPLCFLDFSNGDAVTGDGYPSSGEEAKKRDDVQVKFFVVELVRKLIDKL